MPPFFTPSVGLAVVVGMAVVVAVVTAGLIEGLAVVGGAEVGAVVGAVVVVVFSPQPPMRMAIARSNTSGMSNFFNLLLS